MSIHCLICGSQGNWIPDENEESQEHEEDKNTWTVLRLFHDYLVPEKDLRKTSIEEWWVHTECMRRFIEERTESPTKLNPTARRL